MKTLFVILFMFIITIVMAQESVTIAVKDLTPQQLIQIKEKGEEAKEVVQTLEEKTQSWVGVGKEIGEAMNSGLMAVVEASDKFANTKVGKYTMLFIGWKIIGKDIVKIIIGFIFFLSSLPLIFYSLRRLYPRRVRIKGGQWWNHKEKEYEIIEGPKFDGLEFVKILHIICLGLSFIVTYAIMF